MSKLGELIKELCPNGVEYKTLDEVTILSAGGDVPKENFSKVATDKYCIPIYSNGIGENALYGYTDKAKITSRCVTIAARGTIGYCALRTTPFYPIIRLICAIPKDMIIADYLKYIIDTIKFQVPTTGIPQLTVPMVARYKVPVPPLEVQCEIVHILDSFTALTEELEDKLTAELTARKKQYEYYRDALLTFAECGETIPNDTTRHDTTRHAIIRLIQYVFGYVMLPLDEVAYLFRGEYITKNSTREGNVPVILGGQKPAYYINKSNHEGEIVVVARSGASAGFVSYWNEPIFVTDGFGYEGKTGLAVTKYLYYVLKNMENMLNKMKRGAGVPHISSEALAKIMLPIPRVAEQERIISILDRFDTLCNDISEGILAEIEARQKQYEYYRDKLLDFKELGE